MLFDSGQDRKQNGHMCQGGLWGAIDKVKCPKRSNLKNSIKKLFNEVHDLLKESL